MRITIPDSADFENLGFRNDDQRVYTAAAHPESQSFAEGKPQPHSGNRSGGRGFRLRRASDLHANPEYLIFAAYHPPGDGFLHSYPSAVQTKVPGDRCSVSSPVSA